MDDFCQDLGMTRKLSKCIPAVLFEGSKLQWLNVWFSLLLRLGHGSNIDTQKWSCMSTRRENIIGRLLVLTHKSSNRTFIKKKEMQCYVFDGTPLVKFIMNSEKVEKSPQLTATYHICQWFQIFWLKCSHLSST